MFTVEVIARFGVDKSDPHHKEESYGYVFGNVTKHLGPDEKIGTKTSVLLLVNRELFLKIHTTYENYKSDEKLIDNSNTMDVIRYVPCIEGALCDGAAKSSQIVQNYQFTYVIEDQKEPTYEYISLNKCNVRYP